MVRDVYRDPIFNLKAVVEATGITDDTLRAWERRYGLPDPERTPAGHRIYSQRDIDTVKWLAARQDEGLRISRAVKLWRSLEEKGQDPLRAMRLPAETPEPTGEQLVDLREAWVAGCLAFDEQGAEQALDQAFALHPPEAVCLQIIRKGIADIGQLWYRGEATVQQEHFASHLAMRRIKTLMSGAAAPTRRGRFLVACPPQEQHVIGTSMLAFLLRRAGWDVVYLGPQVPLRHMEQTVDNIRPDLVILGAQQLHTAGTLREVAESLHQKDVPVAFGGGIFNRLPDLRQRVPGHFIGPTLDRAAEAVGSFLVGPPQTPGWEAGPEIYEGAVSQYQDSQLAVQARAWDHLRETDLHPESLRWISKGFSDALLAALGFGDIELLSEYVDWLHHMKSQRHPSDRILQVLLEAYRDAVQAHLNEHGAPIVQWLERQAESPTEGDAE